MNTYKFSFYLIILFFSTYSQSPFETSCKKCREEVSKCIESIGYNSCKESIATCNKVCVEYIKEKSHTKKWKDRQIEIENHLFFYDSDFYKNLTDTQKNFYQQINTAIEEKYQLFLVECTKKNEKIKPYVDNFSLINHYCVLVKLQCFNRSYNMFAFNQLMFDLNIEEKHWNITEKICQSILCDLASKHN
jgi:hypothetical protein